MKKSWLHNALFLAQSPATYYSGNRKILRQCVTTMKAEDFLSEDLTMADAGYTSTKLNMLVRLYYHEESIAMAETLWARRVAQRRYGSVGFTTYNHLLKADPTRKSKRASVMGPCLQSVVLTWLPHDSYDVTVYYRTTEFFKKFPADLVFLQRVIKQHFNLDGCQLTQVNFNFANVTIHPMYFVILVPHLVNPIRTLERLRQADEYFWTWVVKWTARYICPEYEHGIAKFSQALRVQSHVQSRVGPQRLATLRDYVRYHHPGYRR